MISRLVLIMSISTVLFLASEFAQEKSSNKYIGLKKCSVCHKSETKGNQFRIWKESKHSNAYYSLLSDSAKRLAEDKGLKELPYESMECLPCHAIVDDTTLFEKTFDIKDGVQCESCHGAGSAYKAVSIMKDRAKAIEAGMTEYKNEEDIEKQCKSCHNKKSPNYKKFDFQKMWAKVAHPSSKR